MSNRTHQVIFFSPQAGSYVITTPRLWAHENHHHFDPEPRTSAIDSYLEENYGFTRTENDKFVILFNFSLNIGNGVTSGLPFYRP